MKHSLDILAENQPVVVLVDEYPAGYLDPLHRHDHIQVLYASAGVMSVRTPDVSYVIPPQRAVWIPAHTDHEVHCRGPVSLRTLYLKPELNTRGHECRAFEVSPFLKALILEAARLDRQVDQTGRSDRILAMLLEEIELMQSAPYQVNMPRDPRLLKVCEALLLDPSCNRDIDEWASEIGMARRTFTRVFKAETGMGLAMWRQQIRLMEALSLLNEGMSVTRAAHEVGYESASGFSAMFRRHFGQSPREYLVPEVI
tara:strand:+ start:2963 stop:3730 length:768 start_codon:yes stop_codon:yes gene_type:complete